jgi:hypothetical protein
LFSSRYTQNENKVTVMANQNINLLQHHNCNVTCYQSANCRMTLLNNEVGRGEQTLYNNYRILIARNDANREQHFHERMETVVAGYAWMTSCMSRGHYLSFGASLNTHPLYRNVHGDVKKKWCRQISEIKVVFENWDTLRTHFLHPGITNVNIMDLSIRQMSRLIKWEDVVKFNDEHGPRAPRRPVRRLFTGQLVNETALHIIQNTTLFNDTDRDAEQFRLFCNDLSGALQRFAANQ